MVGQGGRKSRTPARRGRLKAVSAAALLLVLAIAASGCIAIKSQSASQRAPGVVSLNVVVCASDSDRNVYDTCDPDGSDNGATASLPSQTVNGSASSSVESAATDPTVSRAGALVRRISSQDQREAPLACAASSGRPALSRRRGWNAPSWPNAHARGTSPDTMLAAAAPSMARRLSRIP